MIDDRQAEGTILAVRPELTNDELNELFTASWPGREPAFFGPVLARSLETTVRSEARRQGLGVRLLRLYPSSDRAG